MVVCAENKESHIVMKRLIIFLFLMISGVSGCGGSGRDAADPVVPPPPVAPPMSPAAFDRLVERDQATILRIGGNIDEGLRGIPGTNWSSVPVTGQSLFMGLGQGRVGDMTFRGDALLTLDFGEDAITGGIQNIIGGDGETTYAADGAIVFTNGDLRADRPSDFSVDYGGTLVFGDDTYLLDGSMTGLLRGTRLGVTERSPIKALSAQDLGGVALVNDVPTPIDLRVVAETR